MRLFIDNNLSPRIARAISALEGEHGNTVVHLRDKYEPNTPDVEWMTSLKNDGSWVVITADLMISRSPHEVQAWKEAGLVVFFLRKSWRTLTLWDQSWQLIKQWPHIISEAREAVPGQGFVVPLRGSKFERI